VPGFSYTSYPVALFFVGVNLAIDLGHWQGTAAKCGKAFRLPAFF
jgi:hypothetical protein